MTERGRHRRSAGVLAGAVVALLGTACAGSGGSNHTGIHAGTRPRAATPRATRAARGSGSTSTTLRARGQVELDHLRPPAVTDRGDDYVAIARSLALYGRWVEMHRPDPALVDRAYAWGSDLERGIRRDVRDEQRLHERIVEVDRVPLAFSLRSALPDAVSFRVTERLARRELVGHDGRVVQRVGPATEHYLVMIVRVAAGQPWRLALVEPEAPRSEVQL